MVQKNWERIADQEFAALDKEAQKDWAELRNRVR